MQRFHPSPHFYVACIVLTILVGILVFRAVGYHDQYFFMLIIGVAVLWSGFFFLRQLQGRSHFTIDRTTPVWVLFRRSIVRYGVWLAVFYGGLTFYETHPYYQDYERNSQFLNALFDAYLRFGLLYFFLTLKFKASRVEDFYDPAIRLLLIAKTLALGALTVRWRPRVRVVLRNKTNIKTLLNLVVRGYFIPVMVVQVYTGLRDGVALADTALSGSSLLVTLGWIAALLWLADSLTASTGYALESRWMENRSRSVDLTVSGWVICLCCYPPLNQVTGTLFAFGPTVVSTDPAALIVPSVGLLYALKILEVIVLSALVYSDLSLGPSGVNITLKKVQARGPYGIVRHPATVCKLTFWWVQSLFYAGFWTPEMLFGHLMWNVIYILRALSEERHLQQFPEYRAYMQKVRYRFIPGVI